MSFNTSAYLRKTTGRAKSDVANKLVSMFLHDLSRRVVAEIGMGVTELAYTEAVTAAFGTCCSYCNRPLELDRAAVEHPEGMNRFRVGLHIPGNVIVACKRCNNEKRRDDSLPMLILAESGWESFLSHDSTRCLLGCKTCAYWGTVWPDGIERVARLSGARERVTRFRNNYPIATAWSSNARASLRERLESLYRECQHFATTQIEAAAEAILSEVRSACGHQDALRSEAHPDPNDTLGL